MTKRAYKYRFYPTSEQEHNFACTFGCVRFVYNWALSTSKVSYYQRGVKTSHNALSHALTVLKQQEGMTWLSEVSSVPLQQSLRHLMRAYTNFFEGRAAYPTFKKRHGVQSATYTDNAFTLHGTSLTLARQREPLNVVWSRPLPEQAKLSSVTVSRDRGGRYFVSLLVEETIEPLPVCDKAIGIDVGLKSFLITSDGETIANPKYYVRDEKKFARAQRRHARKQQGSNNRDRARKKVARLHARIADTRRDFQQKASTKLVRDNQTICFETLSVKNMLKNHCLAKAISDVGWSEFLRQVEYKAAWYGRTVVKVSRWYPSSKTCSACGYLMDAMPLEVRDWLCPSCGACHDRDGNAARNIVAAGLAVLACGDHVRRESGESLSCGGR